MSEPVRETPRRLRERLWVAFDLHRAGLDMKRLSLQRDHPEADQAQIDELLRAWLQDHPAEADDPPAAEGRLTRR